MYQRTQTSMMSASNERRRYMGSRAIGLVIRHLSKEAEFYGNGPQMHRNPLEDLGRFCSGNPRQTGVESSGLQRVTDHHAQRLRQILHGQRLGRANLRASTAEYSGSCGISSAGYKAALQSE